MAESSHEDATNDSAFALYSTETNAPGVTQLPAPAGEIIFPDLKELRETIEEVDIAPLERALDKPECIADISSHRRRLMNNPAQRAKCGFTARVPSRSTFSKVFGQLTKVSETLAEVLTETPEKYYEYAHDLGREVALDSSMIETNSNPNRTPVSDPEAGWGKKRKASAPEGVVWVHGYKAHVVADANHDIPLAVAVTEGNQSDTTYLEAMVEETLPKPEAVIPDRGYDSLIFTTPYCCQQCCLFYFYRDHKFDG